MTNYALEGEEEANHRTAGAQARTILEAGLPALEGFVPREVPILIKLDSGFLLRIEAEREAVTGGTGHRIPRTAMLRMLLKEALDFRARARNEQVPEAILVGRLFDEEQDRT